MGCTDHLLCLPVLQTLVHGVLCRERHGEATKLAFVERIEVFGRARTVYNNRNKTMLLYQVKQELRPYQKKALAIALNSPGAAIALPTGTGKTLVGCAWACQVLNSQQAHRVLVLEPSRFLVEQVEQYYRDKTNIPASKIYGVDAPEVRIAKWKAPVPLLVATPQVAINDKQFLSFDAVIIDECHHTTGNYAYKKLLDAFSFERRLGLSATIHERLRPSVEQSIGPVYAWSWSDPEIKRFVPEWYGEVYDADLDKGEREILKMLGDIRNELRGTPVAGMPSLAITMFSRDGALALSETLQKPTVMSSLLQEAISPLLSRCRPLHKLELLKSVLSEHDFAKAIVFVDRVCVANTIAGEFKELKPVCLLGRLHGGSDAQKAALEQAKDDSVKLVISTSVGEEGIDLPAADLIVSWSNTASPIRFIQRKGRGMRMSPGGKDKAKVDIFIGTPDTPDYDALYFGIYAASRAGVEIIPSEDQKQLLKATTLGRIQECLNSTLDSRAMTLDGLEKATALPLDLVKRYASHLVAEGDIVYVYDFDADDLLERSRKRITGMVAGYFDIESRVDLEEWLHGPYRGERLAMLLNFQMSGSDRLYIDSGILPLLAEGEYARLFNCDEDIRVEVTYGFSSKNRAQGSAYGTWHELITQLEPLLERKTIYLTFAHSRRASVTASYHGRFPEESLPFIVRNACWLAQQAEELGKQMWERYQG